MTAGNSIFQKITGILSDTFQLGGASGPKLMNDSGDIVASNAAGTDMVQVRGALLDGNPDALATWASVTKRFQIRGDFDSSGAAPTNTTSAGYLYCSTGGNGFTAGDLAYDNGLNSGNCIRIARSIGMLITIQAASFGSFVQGAAYIWDGSAWDKFLSGTAGLVQSIEVPFAQSDLTVGSATLDSTAHIPSGARILRSRVETFGASAFDATALTLAVGNVTTNNRLQATTDNDLYTNSSFFVVEGSENGDWDGDHPVRLTLTCSGTGTGGHGSGRVIVEYVTPLS